MFFIADVEVIKQITIKYYEFFVNRDSGISHGSEELLGKSVLFLGNNPWREMRNTLQVFQISLNFIIFKCCKFYRTPIFTSAKMKTMFHHLTSCAQDLTEFLEETLKKEGKIIIESKEFYGRFTAEAISTTTLGLKGNCIKDKNSPVFELARHIEEDLGQKTSAALKWMFVEAFPSVAKFLNIQLFRQSTHDFFKRFVTDEIARREREGITNATDIIQLLIQAKNGQLNGVGEDGRELNMQTKFTNWDDEILIASQVFAFFFGGFESTSKLMEILSWELAMNKEIQNELCKEVDKVRESLNGKTITYEELNKMKFLDMVVHEGLRKWPPAPITVRECSRDYKMNVSHELIFEFKKGDSLLIPIRSIHHDPKYFENPSKFDPYRFSEDNKAKMLPGSFLPFGSGARNCIGSRLALIKTKLALYTTLCNYKFDLCGKTPLKLTYGPSPMGFVEKVFVELKPRKM